MTKINNFANSVNANREAKEAEKAREIAKQIKQYGGIDVYNEFVAGRLVPIVIGNKVVGMGTSEKDAKDGIEFAGHFNGGEPLTEQNIYGVIARMQEASQKAYDVYSSGVKISGTYSLKSGEYLSDEDGELYTMTGEHITNIADLIAAKESIGEKLFTELLNGRIEKYIADHMPEYEEDDEYDEDDEYEDDDYEDDDCEDEYDDEEDNDEVVVASAYIALK